MRRLLLLALSAVFISSVSFAQTPPKPDPKLRPEIQAFFTQADALSKARKYEDALVIYGDALKKAAELRDNYGQGKTLAARGLIYYRLGNLAKALEDFGAAGALYKLGGDKREQAGMMMNQGVVNENMGNFDAALKLYEQAIVVHRAMGATLDVGKTLLNMSLLFSKTNRFAEQMEYGLLAQTELKKAGNRPLEISALINLATAYHYLGQEQKSVKAYEEVVDLCTTPELSMNKANALGNLADSYGSAGENLKALGVAQESLKIYRDLRDIRWEARGLKTLGILYDRMGQPLLAIDNLQQALEIAKKTGDRPLEFSCLTNIGVVLQEEKQDDRAFEFLQQALVINKDLKDESGTATTYAALASIERGRKHYAESLDFYNQSLALFVKIGFKDQQATVNDSIGTLHEKQHLYGQAISHYKRALDMYRETGNKPYQANTLANLASVQRESGQLKEAAATYKSAIDLFESQRSDLGQFSDAKAGFLSRKVHCYREYTSLLAKLHQTDEAFELAQKTKARVLLDVLAEGRVSIAQEMTADEVAREEQLHNQAEALNVAIVKEGAQNEVGSKKRSAVLAKELKGVETQIAEFNNALYIKHPALARKRSTSTTTLAKIGRDLPNDTALLEYVTGETTTLVFVISAKDGVTSARTFEVKVTADQLARECADFRTNCANPKLDYRPLSKKLFAQLVAPAIKGMKGVNRLVVCPDGPLWDVPFAALAPPQGFLANQYEISYAYSATGHTATWKHAKSTAKGSVLVFANPDFGGANRFGDSAVIPGQRPIEPGSRPIEPGSRPIEPGSRDLSNELARGGIAELPGTQLEAQAIEKLYPNAEVLTRGKAQESAFKKLAGDYRYVHIASHAFFNDASPMLSSIVLAVPDSPKEDGYLTAREIFGMKLNADLVVLSACNTARGAKASGEGVVGMSWALFAAGIPTQVISQWSVDDQATAQLMSNFYSRLKAGDKKGDALRKSTLKMSAGKKWSHPYYWAPFVLLGDWR